MAGSGGKRAVRWLMGWWTGAGGDRLEMLGLYAAFAAIYGIWGSTYLAIEVAIETIPPLFMIGLRCLVAGVVLYGLARARGAPAPGREAWSGAVVVGGLLFLGGQGMVAWAEQRIESGAAALLNATVPMFVVMLGWLGGTWAGRVRETRPDMVVLGGLGMGLLGVAFTVGAGPGGTDRVGSAVMLLASLSWAMGLRQASGADPAWPIRRAGMQLVAGGVLLVVAAALAGELSELEVAALTGRSLFALAYLVVFGSLVAFSAFVWLLGKVEASRVASHAYVNPIVAVLLGVAIGGEAIGANTMIGGLLIVFAVGLMVRKREARDDCAGVERRNAGRGLRGVLAVPRANGSQGGTGNAGQSRRVDSAPYQG
ncbi:MAG: EamA family transporter [Longimicrobiales bacterium]